MTNIRVTNMKNTAGKFAMSVGEGAPAPRMLKPDRVLICLHMGSWGLVKILILKKILLNVKTIKSIETKNLTNKNLNN